MSATDIVTDADGRIICENDKTIHRIAFDVSNASPNNTGFAMLNLHLTSRLYMDRLAIDFSVNDVFDGQMELEFAEAGESLLSFADVFSLINRTDNAASIPSTLLHSIRINRGDCYANVSSGEASGDESYILKLLTSVGKTRRQQIKYYDGPSTFAPRKLMVAPREP